MHIRTTIVAAIASLTITGTGLGQVTFEHLHQLHAGTRKHQQPVSRPRRLRRRRRPRRSNYGDLDAMVALERRLRSYGQPNTVWTNDGSGTFTNSTQALGNSDSLSVALGDLDGDGDLDAMVGNYGQPNTVWTNDGSGTFTNSTQALGNSDSLSVALGDLDGDGDLDAMVANNTQPNTVWTNTVTGAGVCCAPSGCVVATGNLAVPCESFGGIYLPNGSCIDCITPATCQGDVNTDGVVDVLDLLGVIEGWGACP